MNKAIFIGNLGRDADLRTLEGGTVAISFNLAIDESYKNAQGEKVPKTTWVNCTKWVRGGGSTAISKYLLKGTKVAVEGSVSVRAYSSKESNEPRASLECNVLNLELLGGTKPTAEGGNVHTQQETPAPTGDKKDDFDDDLPF